ncbi:ATP/maltotriose-dependent transcriptional regulator MalT [Jatrophihabitans sp. GAS493]|uniref:helix-turn-helix transcriptional regulator n=1 Tax=Jatrophihabitans sp. GAS493 TaxID=1907575 RepID=UPI000BB78A02|nr:AAA family ATPase [Jatrophihabitans sp. GAS493]SOD74953.1 ATP/maltotriose-dependent transcriptional regulator MalT [Jatrophihabitans sp. GAS493]
MRTHELVGRDRVLADLFEAVSAAGERGDAILLVGEAGIGKTACLTAVAALAQDAGYPLLRTVGSEAERQLPFAGLHRLLRPILASTATLPDVQRRALLDAFGMHDGAAGDRFVVSIATVNLLSQMSARHPLVIIADDVQWLDEQTRHVLAFVARRLGTRVVFVAAATSLPQLRELGDGFRELRLNRLDVAEAHRLLTRLAPGLDPGQRQAVADLARGNPLALIELAAAPPTLTTKDCPIPARISLSPQLERAFAGRHHELPQSGRDVLLVAAVASDASLPEILAATARMSGGRVGPEVLEPAQQLGLLSFDENQVIFSHPLVKAAVVQKESISRRQSAHRALGAVITVSSLRRAWHRAFGTSSYDDVIAAELEATTAASIKSGRAGAAILALERAAQLSVSPAERGRRLLLAARQAARLGRPDEVDRLLQGVVNSELSEFDRVRAELLHENVGGVVITDSLRVTHLCALARRATAEGERSLAVELADAAVRRRCAAPVEAPALADMISLAQGLWRGSSEARCVAVLALADPVAHGREVISALEAVDERGITDGEELSAYAVAARAVGDYTAAVRFLDRAEVLLRERGLLGPLARALCVVADLQLEVGDWDRAAAALAEFARLSVASMSVSHRAAAMATTAKIAALRGETAAALELVSDTEHSPAARSGSRYLARAQIVRGIVGISADKHGETYAALRRVFDPMDPSHHFREQFDAVSYLAEAAAHTGQQAQARKMLDDLQLVADRSGSPLLQMHLAYGRAVLASDDTAEKLFLACLASEAASLPWQRARVQLAYGRWLRRQQRVSQSREPLRSALTTLQRLGAVKWAAEALDELEASGAADEPGSNTGSPHSLLSVQESKVARLASQGMSNREIGQQLYISPRTVSSHLYRIFPKLGISTRGQIAARLDELYLHSDSR